MNFSDSSGLPEVLAAAKQAARKSARAVRDAARRTTPGAPRLAASQALGVAGPLRNIGRVAGYLPIGSELDPRPLLLALHGLGVPLCMPVVVADGAPLAFLPWVPGTATARSAFGVEEPQEGDPVVPDLLLVPLLAFDLGGHRLGYGGGFYDRTLVALRAEGRPRALGYAYAAQQVGAVPADGRDARLDGIVTERGVIWTSDPAIS